MGCGSSHRYLNHSAKPYLQGEGSAKLLDEVPNQLQSDVPNRLQVLSLDAAERSKLLGVSLEYILNDFVFEARQATSLEDTNFHIISGELARGERGKGKDLLCPRDQRKDCSIVDALDQQEIDAANLATHFLSWCWAYSLSMYIESWQFWLHQNRKRGVKSGNVFVWQCFFCNNQYRIEENKDAINDSLGDIFRTRLLKIRNMVVLLDQFMDPNYLRRIWCVYEMYTAVTSSDVSIDFMLPPQQASSIQNMMRQSHGIEQIEENFERVDSESATASKPADAEKVKHEIRQSLGGFDAVNQKVVEKMKEWVQQQFSLLMRASGPSPSRKTAKFNLPGFLRKSGLGEQIVKKIQTAGVKTYQDLLFIADELEEIELTESEAREVQEMLQKGLRNAGNKDWKVELQELGLPYFSFAHLTEEEAGCGEGWLCGPSRLGVKIIKRV